MPAGIIVELIASLLLEVVGHLAVGGAQAAGEAATDWASETAEKRKRRRQAQAIAAADLLVIAAWYDRTITEAERAELERRLPPILAKRGDEQGLEEIADRGWERVQHLSTDEELRALIEQIAAVLDPRTRGRVFEGVVALALADATLERPARGPFRERAPRSNAESVRVFGEALAIEPERVRRALVRLAAATR